MAFVRVEQRHAHLAGPVRLQTVAGREGSVSKATLTAISNTRRGGRGEGGDSDTRDSRGDESTAIQWTLWGKQADNAAQYLGKGSHGNVWGRVQNNNDEKDGATVYSLTFTVAEADYLDTRATGDAMRAGQGPGAVGTAAAAAGGAGADAHGTETRPAATPNPARGRKAGTKAAAEESADSIPF